MKTCRQCKRKLPVDQFYKAIRGRDGVRACCKKCVDKRNVERKIAAGGWGIDNRMAKYGLTRQEVEAYLQIPACQICNKPFQCDADIHIDHCHQHGTIRGVLCKICNNTLIGTTAECIVRNERANDYLLRSMEARLEPARAG